MNSVADEVRALGAKVVEQQVDLSELSAIKSAASALHEEHSIAALDVLINNAGIVKDGPFWEHDFRTSYPDGHEC